MTDSIPGYRTGTWNIDAAHSDIGFSVRHLMISKVRGSFREFSGTIVTAIDPLDSAAEVIIGLASVDTRNAERDAHLRSSDFFDVEARPVMKYRSTAVRRAGDHFEVEGDLTIHDITRSVVLAVEYNGVGPDPWGGERIGLSATGAINRSDFGVTFNMPLEGGGMMIGDTVQLAIEVEATLHSD